jgi:hypothetical protein
MPYEQPIDLPDIAVVLILGFRNVGHSNGIPLFQQDLPDAIVIAPCAIKMPAHAGHSATSCGSPLHPPRIKGATPRGSARRPPAPFVGPIGLSGGIYHSQVAREIEEASHAVSPLSSWPRIAVPPPTLTHPPRNAAAVWGWGWPTRSARSACIRLPNGPHVARHNRQAKLCRESDVFRSQALAYMSVLTYSFKDVASR